MRALRRILLVCGALLAPLQLSAQARPGPAARPARQTGPGVISGSVMAEGGGALAGATVAVRRMADSVLVGGKVTGQDGRFEVTGLPTGEYLVQFAALNRVSHTERGVVISAAAPTRDLGSVRLAAQAVAVEGVTGRGQRSPVVMAPDRNIYSLRDMPVVQGGTATDALRTIPELQVDIDDKITARGATPAIHLNGRPAPMQGDALVAFLRTLPADRIDRIEYIANPSARYEAEGSGGIVNIVLRQDASLGLSGTLTGTAGTQGTGSGATRLNYQQGRLTFFGGASLRGSQNTARTSDLRANYIANPVTFLQQSALRQTQNLGGSVDGNAELKLSPKVTAWSGFTGNLNGSNADGTTNFVLMDAAQAPTQRFDRVTGTDTHNRSLTTSLGLRRVIQAQRNEFSTELRYSTSHVHSATNDDKLLRALSGELLSLPPELTDNDGFHDEPNWSYQADLSHPWGAAGRIDAGYRWTLRNNQDEQFREISSASTPASSQHDLFRYREQFNAAYVTGDRKLGKLGVTLGLRAERSDTRIRVPTSGQSFANHYTDIFPNANLAYDFGKGRQLRLSYSKRIGRPTSGVLNPIDRSSDPLNRQVGNPHLAPQYLNAFSLDGVWTRQTSTLRLSNGYTRANGAWEQIRTVDANGVSTVTSANNLSGYMLTSTASASFQPHGPVSGSFNLGLAHLHLKPGKQTNTPGSSSFLWYTGGNALARLSPTLSVQLSGTYNGRQRLSQGTYAPSFYSSMAVRQQLLKNKASLSFSVVDPLGVYRSTYTTQDASHQQTGRTNPSFRRATLSLSYNFGRTPQSNRRTVQDQQGGDAPLGGGDIR